MEVVRRWLPALVWSSGVAFAGSASAIVIGQQTSITDGWVLRQLYDASGRPAGVVYESENQRLTPGQDSFSVLSASNALTVSSAIGTSAVTVSSLRVNDGASLTASYATLGTLSMGGGQLSAQTLQVTGAAGGHGQLAGDRMSFGRLELSGGSLSGVTATSGADVKLSDTRLDLSNLAAASTIELTRVTAGATQVFAQERITVRDSSIGVDQPRVGRLEAKAVELVGSTLFLDQLYAERSFSMQTSRLDVGTLYAPDVDRFELADGRLAMNGWTGAARVSLHLASFGFLAASSRLQLDAGASGTQSLGMDGSSTLSTLETGLWGDRAGATPVTFVQAGGVHKTGELVIRDRTAYSMQAPAAGLQSAVLDAGQIVLAGHLGMGAGEMHTQVLAQQAEGSFEQSGGTAHVAWGDLQGRTRLLDTARLEGGSIGLDGTLDIEDAAAVEVDGSFRMGPDGRLAMTNPGDTSGGPVLHAVQSSISGSFVQRAGRHLADHLSIYGPETAPAAARYELEGGELAVGSGVVGGQLTQSGGKASFDDLWIMADTHSGLPAIRLAGGRLQVGRLKVEASGSPQVPWIEQVAGDASFGQMILDDGRYVLDIAAGADSAVHRLTTGQVVIRGERGSFEHRGGELVATGRMEVEQGGSYLLAGGSIDGTDSAEPFEVLQKGRYRQTGGDIRMHGLAVDAQGRAEISGGSASFREWAAIGGVLELSGTTTMEVGGSKWGLHVGIPFVPEEPDEPLPESTGLLRLGPGFAGRLESSQVHVGSYQKGEVQHLGGTHVVTGALTLGSRREVIGAAYYLGSAAALQADSVVLDNTLARDDAQRAQVLFDQQLGMIGRFDFGSFLNDGGVHRVHRDENNPDDPWEIADFRRPDGTSAGAGYRGRGGVLLVDTGLRLRRGASMYLEGSDVLAGRTEIGGSVSVEDLASLAVVQQAALPKGEPPTTMRIQGGLWVGSAAGAGTAAAAGKGSVRVWNATMELAGQPAHVGSGPVLAIGSAALPAATVATMRVEGPSASVKLSGTGLTQVQVGRGGAGRLSLEAGGVLEVRAPRSNGAAVLPQGDWRPVVVGEAGGARGELWVDAASRLTVEGKGNHLTVVNGAATVLGQLNTVVLGKPQTSPALMTAPWTSTGRIDLSGTSLISVGYAGGYVPAAGDFIPLISAQTIAYGPADAYLTAYKSANVNGQAGYSFGFGEGNVQFQVATPKDLGLYPALQRMRLDGVEVLGIRYVDQAVMLNFADPIQGHYKQAEYIPSASEKEWLPLSTISSEEVAKSFGKALMGVSAQKGAGGTTTLGDEVLLPYFVLTSTDENRDLRNAVDVRFSSAELELGSEKLLGHAPGELNGGNLLDVGNQQKSGRAHVFYAGKTAAPYLIANIALHEIGHTLGLVHTYNPLFGLNYMDYEWVRDESFVGAALSMYLDPRKGGGGQLQFTQSAMLHLLKYSFGWSEAELQAFGADYGNLDVAGLAALRDAMVAATGVATLADPSVALSSLAVLVPSLSAEGAELWEPVLFLESADAQDLQRLLFAGLRGQPFRIVASSSAADPYAFDILFESDEEGITGTFAEGVALGRIVRIDPVSGGQTVLGSYTLAQSAAAVPEPAGLALFLLGLAMLGLRRAANRGMAGPRQNGRQEVP